MTEIASLAEGFDAHAERLGELLTAAAAAAGHPFGLDPVALEARRGEAFAGGLSGAIGFGWLRVHRLAVAPEARGQGIGTRLLRRAEAIARERGALGVQLDTFAFQAPAFYERLGYVQVGLMPGRVPAEARHYFLLRFGTPEGGAA